MKWCFKYGAVCLLGILLTLGAETALSRETGEGQGQGQGQSGASRQSSGRDRGKGAIEFGTKTVVKGNSSTVSGPVTDNPKTEAGKVKWHPDFETAKAAAAKSKKPVLLFQMLGKLDEKFC